jgi:hypothetical protein
MEPDPNNTPQIRAIIDGLNRKIELISREAERQIDAINDNKRAILRDDVTKRAELDRLLEDSQQQVHAILSELASSINTDFTRLLTQYSEGNIDKSQLETFMGDSITNIREKSRSFNEKLGDRIAAIKANVESSSTGMSCFTELRTQGLTYAKEGLKRALRAPAAAYTAATDLTSGVCAVVQAMGDFLSLFDVAGGSASDAASVRSNMTTSSTDSLQGLLATIEELADVIHGSGDNREDVIYQMSQAVDRSDASTIASSNVGSQLSDSQISTSDFETPDERSERFKRQRATILQGETPDNSQGYGGKRKSKHHKKSKKSKKTKKHYKKQRGGKKHRQTKKGYSKKRTLKRYKKRAYK